MTYNRKPCVALFLEAEYDALIIEAYSESRVTTEKLKNGRYPFSCIFCKEIHKDKNMTSYHRMFNLCKVYQEPAALKMYPTWEKSDHAELNRVAKKHGRVFALNMPTQPSAGAKRKSEDVLQSPPSKRRHISHSAAPKQQLEGPCRQSRSRVSPKPMHVKFQVTHELSNDTDEQSDASESQREEKDDNEIETSPYTGRVSCDGRSSSPETTSADGEFRVVTHIPAVPILTRKDVEERAWVEARRKFPVGNSASVPPPPTPVEVSGIYTLITEVNVDWLPKELLKDPQGCLDFLYKMVEDGSLGVKLGSAFGTWYLYGDVVSFLFCAHSCPLV